MRSLFQYAYLMFIHSLLLLLLLLLVCVGWKKKVWKNAELANILIRCNAGSRICPDGYLRVTTRNGNVSGWCSKYKCTLQNIEQLVQLQTCVFLFVLMLFKMLTLLVISTKENKYAFDTNSSYQNNTIYVKKRNQYAALENDIKLILNTIQVSMLVWHSTTFHVIHAAPSLRKINRLNNLKISNLILRIGNYIYNSLGGAVCAINLRYRF